MQPTASADRPITVRWTMEADDLLGGSLLYQRRTWLFMRVCVVGTALLGVLTWVIDAADPSAWLPPIVIAVLLGLYLVVGIRRSVNRIGRSLIGEPVVFWVDTEGAHEELAGGHIWVEWRALTDVIENATTIVIKRDRLPSSFIPKRAFASAAATEAFLAYVRSHLATK